MSNWDEKWYMYRNKETGAEVRRNHPFDSVRLAQRNLVLINVIDLKVSDTERKAK